MSRIGKLHIQIPAGVTVEVSGLDVHIKGPKGEFNYRVNNNLTVSKEENELVLSIKTASKKAPAFWGTERAKLANMIKGVTTPFEKKLELVGVGYRAKEEGKNLSMTLGFSHPIIYPIPEGIKIQVEDQRLITVTGADKELVGLVAAQIRAFRKPEPYKGKGIKYVDEVIRRKVGKTGKA